MVYVLSNPRAPFENKGEEISEKIMGLGLGVSQILSSSGWFWVYRPFVAWILKIFQKTSLNQN